jgi:hypothetical protein
LTNGIVNGDINSAAAIADSKLATISTAGKVSAAAITNLASIGGGVLPVANGGTGASTAQTAIDALLPAQGSAAGQFLKTDGTNASWGAVTSLALGDYDSRNITTDYQAGTDGFVVFYGKSDTGAQNFIGKIGASSPAATEVAYASLDTSDLYTCFMFPVKKNNYYRIDKTQSSAVTYIMNFVPLS